MTACCLQSLYGKMVMKSILVRKDELPDRRCAEIWQEYNTMY